jgi:hypothetical protein
MQVKRHFNQKTQPFQIQPFAVTTCSTQMTTVTMMDVWYYTSLHDYTAKREHSTVGSSKQVLSTDRFENPQLGKLHQCHFHSHKIQQELDA